MKLGTLTAILAGSLLAMPGCMMDEDLETEELASEMEDEGGGHGEHNCPGPSPILTMGDFDGNGIVDNADKAMLNDFRQSGDYAAYFDMNADGKLTGQDVSIVARNKGEAPTARDVEMTALWQAILPYRDIGAAMASGYVPFTPDLQGHGIHFANFGLIYSWNERGGWNAGQPEGLNYTDDGELVAAFYYAPAAIDLYDYGAPLPADMFFQEFAVPPSFDGMADHEWHNHVGPCFGGATSPVPGFDQCTTEAYCTSVGGQLWSPKFHMLHVWMFEYNECGPFGGIDADISVDAPMEPNHGACDIEDIVHCVVTGWHPDGTPMCKESGGGGHGGH